MIGKTKSPGRIRVLDPHVANKIAAGEVVERPASVVKELVENALDAHATRIEVHVERGGTRLVRVVDDGGGIGREDLLLAFLPHATSKLADVDDLESIATLGFRGEALASIGAVAQARILSRVEGAEKGFEIEDAGGALSAVRAAAAAKGTDVAVRNLFFNTPARARFLRSARTELGHIEDLVRCFALAFPEVGFRLVHDGEERLRALPGEDRRARLRTLFGPELEGQLLPVREGGIEAYLGPPSVTRPNARDLHFFVNGRYIRDRILLRVVKDAYRDAMHGGRYPVAFLFLEVDPATIDVNVHPAKAEIRWRDPQWLHAAVAPLLARALRGADLSLSDGGEARAGPAGSHAEGVRAAMADFMRRAAEGHVPRVHEGGAGGPAAEGTRPPEPPLFGVFQAHDSWLVCEVEDGLAIVDQHALHERVQYDRILKRLSEGSVDAQRLLVPEEVELGAADCALLEERKDLLARCGIAFSPFGERSVAVETLPAVVPRARAGDLLRDLAELLRAHAGAVDPRTLFHDVADTMACKAAVRFGDRLSREEVMALLRESGALDKAFVCPHGRPTVWRIPFSELRRRFGRS
ncbi:MAG TPA: DNA mismatch repair endonuclease MutL [Planctomycetota bacterium]|nr:DNA mismatch repair endonuclease MutL [Planctomycetota bacterium]